MGVEGDLQAVLTSQHNMTQQEATKLLQVIFETINDPDFAYRFAHDEADEGADESEINNLMLNYWDVIRFLKNII